MYAMIDKSRLAFQKLIREGWCYQIGWIFGKNSKRPSTTPSLLENYIANFFYDRYGCIYAPSFSKAYNSACPEICLHICYIFSDHCQKVPPIIWSLKWYHDREDVKQSIQFKDPPLHRRTNVVQKVPQTTKPSWQAFTPLLTGNAHMEPTHFKKGLPLPPIIQLKSTKNCKMNRRTFPKYNNNNFSDEWWHTKIFHACVFNSRLAFNMDDDCIEQWTWTMIHDIFIERWRGDYRTQVS